MLAIHLAEHRTAFRPGDAIAGTVEWNLPDAPRNAEIRLTWCTSGKGTEDSETVESRAITTPSRAEQRSFEFVAPAEPYSFSGKLVSLTWAIEFVVEPGDEFERVEIVIGPDAREIVLPSIEPPSDKNLIPPARHDVR